MSMYGEWSKQGMSENDYKYNGKELNSDKGLRVYEYGARFYDPSIGIFTSVDPLSSEFSSWTPYHYVHNNPLRFTDPTGMSAEEVDDHIKVNSSGQVTEVIKMEGDNRFFDDISGEEIFLHAPNDYDNNLKHGVFQEGNCIYTCLGTSEVNQLVKEGGNLNDIVVDESFTKLAETATRSYKSDYADFPLKLVSKFDLQQSGNGPFTEIKGDMFRIENIIYNPSDAGQFMWGAWMRSNGYSKMAIWAGSNWNERKHGGDSAADQRAIYQGVNWQDKY